MIAILAYSVFIVAKKPTLYGLDVRGGIRAVLQADVAPGQEASYDQATVQQILENRLNASGVAEPVIIPSGQRRFIAEIPNVHNKDAIMQQLQTTAQLQIIWVKDVVTDRDLRRALYRSSDYRRDRTRAVHVYRSIDARDIQGPGADRPGFPERDQQ